MLYFMYDSNNELIGFKYNDETYYYKKNYQEDIIGIYNSNYEQIVYYTYNSWGKILSVKDNNNNEITDTNHIGIINPFRYRSYYYDEETKLYYLNTRYYNPEWCRFINADGYVSTGTGMVGYNMYAYCNNVVINSIDFQGKAFFKIKLAVKVAADLIKYYTNKEAQTEIEKVQQKKNVSDKTMEFEEVLRKNAEQVKKDTSDMNYIEKLGYMYQSTKSGSYYDLKLQNPWVGNTIRYHGINMDAQDVGNFHYGYIGRAAGLDEFTLTAAGGAAQLVSGNRDLRFCLTSRCDDPRDSYYIIMGIQKYDLDYNKTSGGRGF